MSGVAPQWPETVKKRRFPNVSDQNLRLVKFNLNQKFAIAISGVRCSKRQSSVRAFIFCFVCLIVGFALGAIMQNDKTQNDREHGDGDEENAEDLLADGIARITLEDREIESSSQNDTTQVAGFHLEARIDVGANSGIGDNSQNDNTQRQVNPAVIDIPRDRNGGYWDSDGIYCSPNIEAGLLDRPIVGGLFPPWVCLYEKPFHKSIYQGIKSFDNTNHASARMAYMETDALQDMWTRRFFLNLLMKPSWVKDRNMLRQAYDIGLIYLRISTSDRLM
jgi:hypothetical protein